MHLNHFRYPHADYKNTTLSLYSAYILAKNVKTLIKLTVQRTLHPAVPTKKWHV